mgnify:CR=1 FL=1
MFDISSSLNFFINLHLANRVTAFEEVQQKLAHLNLSLKKNDE